jgi:hypothetical protein
MVTTGVRPTTGMAVRLMRAPEGFASPLALAWSNPWWYGFIPAMRFVDMSHDSRRRDGRQGAAHYVWDQDTGLHR